MSVAAVDGRPVDIFADAHVHIYPFMSVRALLDAAHRNLLGNRSGAGDAGILLVADPEGVRGFERLLRHGRELSPANAPTDGGNAVSADTDSRYVTFRRASGTRIIAIRGQQLITREGLEVLGIGHRSDLPSGLSLAQVVEGIRASGGWSILAWGVGKWLGRRGRLVTDLIVAEGGRPDVMLADNGGRPWFWSRVPQFETAAERGMRVLAGTDPLPLIGEEKRVGSYGFRVRVECVDGEELVDSFRRVLEHPGTPVQTIGAPMAAGGFVSRQLRLRLRNRLPGQSNQ